MKYLADENVEKEIVNFLRKSGYDIKWIAEEMPSLDDERILELANQEKRFLITNDKDYTELIFRKKRISLGILLFRIKGQSVSKKIDILKELIKNKKIRENYFIVILDHKIRFIRIKKE